jgi:hypothetical protein
MNIEDIKKLRALAVAADQPHSGVARDYFRQSVTAPRILTLLDLAERQLNCFQQRVQPWMLACFGETIAGDQEERNHRFLEEALELVQSTGCTASEAHQLVDYVYGRPVGEPAQEVGGVMVTLAALCLANGLDMHAAAETELARIWTKVEQIRAKQAAKPKHSPLPEAAPQQHAEAAQPFASGAMQAMADAGLDVSVGGDKIQPRGVTGNAQAALSDELPPLPDDSLIAVLMEAADNRQYTIGEYVEWCRRAANALKAVDDWRKARATRQPAPVASTPADAAPAWDADATRRLRSIVDLLGLKSCMPDGDLTGYEFTVLGFVRMEIERLKADRSSTAQGDVLSQDAGGDLISRFGLLLAQSIEMVDGCMDETQVESEDAAAWHIVRKHFLAQRAASQPDSERDAAPTAQQERAWFKEWVAGRQGLISVDQVEFGRLAWVERARRAAKGGE